MSDEIILPEEWKLSPQQDVVIGSLIDEPGEYQHPKDFCDVLYGEVHEVAPAKLRVLIQRCREILEEITDGKVKIVTKRGKGWKLLKRDGMMLQDLVEELAQE